MSFKSWKLGESVRLSKYDRQVARAPMSRIISRTPTTDALDCGHSVPIDTTKAVGDARRCKPCARGQ